MLWINRNKQSHICCGRSQSLNTKTHIWGLAASLLLSTTNSLETAPDRDTGSAMQGLTTLNVLFLFCSQQRCLPSLSIGFSLATKSEKLAETTSHSAHEGFTEMVSRGFLGFLSFFCAKLWARCLIRSVMLQHNWPWLLLPQHIIEVKALQVKMLILSPDANQGDEFSDVFKSEALLVGMS